MLISDNFREGMNNLPSEIKEIIGLDQQTDINEETAQLVLLKFFNISGNHLVDNVGGSTIVLAGVDKIISIDSEYVRVKENRRTRIFSLDKVFELLLLLKKTKIKFKEGDTVIGLTRPTLRQNREIIFDGIVGKYFKIVRYISLSETVVNRVFGRGHEAYFLAIDSKGERFVIKQSLVRKVSIKLEETSRHELKLSIINSLKQSHKSTIQAFETEYSRTLRNYLQASKQLKNRQTTNIEKRADELLDNVFLSVDKLEKFENIESVSISNEYILEVNTGALYLEGDKEACLGKYTIVIDVHRNIIKMRSPAISSARGTHSYHHPHISGTTICWGQWSRLLKKSREDLDLFAVVNVCLEFLQHYNGEDPYKNKGDWFDEYGDIVKQ